MAELPSKLFFRIGEVAGLVGVEPHVLRYWEREFRSIRPTKSAKGQRVYSRKDVENLLRVKELLYRDGFTIAGARKRLSRAPEDVADAAPESAPASLMRDGRRDGRDGHDDGPDTEAHVEPAGGASEATSNASEDDTKSDASGRVREKLEALRNEVETFLTELDSVPREATQGAARAGTHVTGRGVTGSGR